MPDPQPEIVAQVFEEADRLRRGDGRLEFLRTTEIIERHLSPPPAVVVDRGGRRETYTRPLKATGSTGSTWYRATSMPPGEWSKQGRRRLPSPMLPAVADQRSMIQDQKGFLSHVSDNVGTMEARQIASLFTTAGVTVEIVYEGSPAGCPHCHDPGTLGPAEAA